MRSSTSILLGSVFVLGCSSATMSVNVIDLRDGVSEGAAIEPASALPSGERCRVRYFRKVDRLHKSCALVGSVDLYDASFSSDCGTDRVRREVSRVACDLGGEAAVVKRQFYDLKACIDAHADIYDCRSTATLEALEAQSSQ